MSGNAASATGDSSGSQGSGNAASIGGDAGPATSGALYTNPSMGDKTFNFNQPSSFFGVGKTGQVIKGVVILVALAIAGYAVKQAMPLLVKAKK